jgi:hypothetical protein
MIVIIYILPIIIFISILLIIFIINITVIITYIKQVYIQSNKYTNALKQKLFINIRLKLCHRY